MKNAASLAALLLLASVLGCGKQAANVGQGPAGGQGTVIVYSGPN